MKLACRLLLLLVFVGACRAPESKPAAGAARIISLAPSVTETLFAIGAGADVVGVTDYCTYPAEAQQRTHVGSLFQPNYEAIARLKPTLILGTRTQTSPEDKLAALAKTRMLPWLSVAEVVSSIRELGTLTGHESDASALAQRIETRVKPKAAVAGPRVLLVLAGPPGPFSEVWFVRQNSLHGSVLAATGARNAVAEDVNGAAVLSLERVIALDPDAVVILIVGDGVDPKLQQQYVDAWKALPMLKAVKMGQVKVLAGAEVESVGPRILTFADRLESLVKTLPQ